MMSTAAAVTTTGTFQNIVSRNDDSHSSNSSHPTSSLPKKTIRLPLTKDNITDTTNVTGSDSVAGSSIISTSGPTRIINPRRLSVISNITLSERDFNYNSEDDDDGVDFDNNNNNNGITMEKQHEWQDFNQRWDQPPNLPRRSLLTTSTKSGSSSGNFSLQSELMDEKPLKRISENSESTSTTQSTQQTSNLGGIPLYRRLSLNDRFNISTSPSSTGTSVAAATTTSSRSGVVPPPMPQYQPLAMPVRQVSIGRQLNAVTTTTTTTTTNNTTKQLNMVKAATRASSASIYDSSLDWIEEAPGETSSVSENGQTATTSTTCSKTRANSCYDSASAVSEYSLPMAALPPLAKSVPDLKSLLPPSKPIRQRTLGDASIVQDNNNDDDYDDYEFDFVVTEQDGKDEEIIKCQVEQKV